MNTTITRTAYCAECAAKGRPYSGDYFLVYRGLRQDYAAEVCEERTHAKDYGFTPHLFTMVERKDGILVVEKICGMHDCGIWLGYSDDDEIVYSVKHRSYHAMTIEQWNNLIRATNLGYNI